MSHIVNGVPVITDEPDQECEACVKVEETRPYGPGGMRLCFSCGMSPTYKETVEANLERFLDGISARVEKVESQ